jgi:hypothetical protein
MSEDLVQASFVLRPLRGTTAPYRTSPRITPVHGSYQVAQLIGSNGHYSLETNHFLKSKPGTSADSTSTSPSWLETHKDSF